MLLPLLPGVRDSPVRTLDPPVLLLAALLTSQAALLQLQLRLQQRRVREPATLAITVPDLKGVAVQANPAAIVDPFGCAVS